MACNRKEKQIIKIIMNSFIHSFLFSFFDAGLDACGGPNAVELFSIYQTDLHIVVVL